MSTPGRRPAKKTAKAVAPLAAVSSLPDAAEEKRKREDAAADLTVTEALATGDERRVLVAMSQVVARKLDDPNISGRDLAANTRRLHEITKDIKAIDERRRGLLPSQSGVEGATGTDDQPFDGSGV